MNLDKAIIFTTPFGVTYLGELDEVTGVEGADLMNCVRQLVVENIPKLGPRGEPIGMQFFAALLPVHLCDGPLDGFEVQVTTRYYVKDNPRIHEKLKNLIRNAEENETARRAESAGIKLR
jgi:hypothetical protein